MSPSDVKPQHIIVSFKAEFITAEVHSALLFTLGAEQRLGGAFCPDCRRHYTMLKPNVQWFAPVPHITCADCVEKKQ